MIEGIRLRAQLRPVWEKVSSALEKIQDLHVLQKIWIYKKKSRIEKKLRSSNSVKTHPKIPTL